MKKNFLLCLLIAFCSVSAVKADENTDYFKGLVEKMRANFDNSIVAEMEMTSPDMVLTYQVYRKGVKSRVETETEGMRTVIFSDDTQSTIFIPKMEVLTTQVVPEDQVESLLPNEKMFEGCKREEMMTKNGYDCQMILCEKGEETLRLCISDKYYMPVYTETEGLTVEVKNIRQPDLPDSVFTPPTSLEDTVPVLNY